MDWLWTSIILLLTLPFLLKSFLSNSKKLPPGPKGFPILGSLNLLGEFPHRDLENLSKKHGPIMFMKLGLIPTIVVSSPQYAELFLKTHDLDFASRPPLQAAKHISYEQKNLSFAAYGSYWRNIRKMCTLELLSSLKINAYKSMRKHELGLLIKSLRENERAVVDVSARISSLSADISCLMVFGKKYEDKDIDERGFKAVIQEGMHLAAVPNLGDYIPFIAPFDFQGLTKRMKDISKVFDAFFEKIIDEHIQNFDAGRTKDFVDVMLSLMESQDNEYKVERSNIKAIILDMLAASMDTSATAIEWGLSELLRHPTAMKKLQKELEQVVGMKKMLEETQLENLPYLNNVIKETLRLHPVAPLLLPHAAIKDTKVNNYDIPKNCRVIVNAWAIGRDPKVWHEADSFRPERFEENGIDLKGRDFELLPFGSGRRGCPGLQLGLTMVKLILGQIVHCFDWELPNGMRGDELDMGEEFGVTIPRAKHLLAIPTYRLSI